MKSNLILMGLGATVIIIFACAILSSAFTLIGFDIALSSGAIEKKLGARFQEEFGNLTLDCNSTYAEKALTINFEGAELYCSLR